MTLHRITEICTECFNVCPNITSKYRITAIFKSIVKQSSDSNKTYRYVHELLQYECQTSCNLQVQKFISCLHKTKYEFQLSTALHVRRHHHYYHHHHHHLQGLGLLACSDLPVRRIDPSVSSVVDLYLSTFVFLVSHKNGLVKIHSSLEDPSAYKVSWVAQAV
jgi:hypothetical protein